MSTTGNITSETDDTCFPLVRFEKYSEGIQHALYIVETIFFLFFAYSIYILSSYYTRRNIHPISKSYPTVTAFAAFFMLIYSLLLFLATDPSFELQDNCTLYSTIVGVMLSFLILLEVRAFYFYLAAKKYGKHFHFDRTTSMIGTHDVSSADSGDMYISIPESEAGNWVKLKKIGLCLPISMLLGTILFLASFISATEQDLCLCEGPAYIIFGGLTAFFFGLISVLFYYKLEEDEKKLQYGVGTYMGLGFFMLLLFPHSLIHYLEDEFFQGSKLLLGLATTLNILMATVYPLMYNYMFIYVPLVESKRVTFEVGPLYAQMENAKQKKKEQAKEKSGMNGLFSRGTSKKSKGSSTKNKELDITELYEVFHNSSRNLAQVSRKKSIDSEISINRKATWGLGMKTPEEYFLETGPVEIKRDTSKKNTQKTGCFGRMFRFEPPEEEIPEFYSIPLAQILMDEQGYKLFYKFCVKELSSENPIFYAEANKFIKEFKDPAVMTPQEILRFKTKTRTLFLKHVLYSGEMPINIPSKITQMFKDGGCAPRVPLDIILIQKAFIEALNEIYTLMYRDSYARFRRTPEFQNYMKELSDRSDGYLLFLKRLINLYTLHRFHFLSTSTIPRKNNWRIKSLWKRISTITA
eukprot:snap_masked-scaffold_11-processed-gene-4.10-mRNA-1 protein AED:1.00 eAED:1.00 QI:0/0/0/0/1/1/2/0/636